MRCRRRLDRLQLRGRVEPVEVFVLEEREFADLGATLFGSLISGTQPDGLRLIWQDLVCDFSTADIPVVIGRSELASCRIDDNRVSRSHARIEWDVGTFQLLDKARLAPVAVGDHDVDHSSAFW
jgi:hypothetical protein